MRTTLNISDDVLMAIKQLARHQRRSVGQVISDLARQTLISLGALHEQPESFLGFRPFPSRGGVVTSEIVERLENGGIDR